MLQTTMIILVNQIRTRKEKQQQGAEIDRRLISHHSVLSRTAQPLKLASISLSGARPLKYFT